jgi:hypothetical protein
MITMNHGCTLKICQISAIKLSGRRLPFEEDIKLLERPSLGF